MLALIMFYVIGFALVMSVVSIIAAPIYLFIKHVITHGENNVSMCAVFAVVDAILTVFTCIGLLPSFFEDTMASFFGKWGAIILIPTMIVCFIGAVIIHRVQYYKNEELQKLIDSEQEINSEN